MALQKVRLSEETMNRLQVIAAALVQPSERHTNQRRDTTDVGPLVRLIGEGKIVPVRMPTDMTLLEVLLHAYVDEGIDIYDPAQAGAALTRLLNLIATRKLRLGVN